MDVYSQSGFNRKKSANISPNKNRLSDTQNQYIQRTGSTMKNGTKSAKKIKMWMNLPGSLISKAF